MSVQCLVSATAHAKALKGQIFNIKDIPAEEEGSPFGWNSKEGLPNWIVVEITGTNKAQADAFLERVDDAWTYDVVTAGGIHTVTLTVHPKILANFDNGLKQELRDHLENEYGATFTSWNPETGVAVFEVADTVDIPALKADIHDLFSENLGPRYKFANSDVDNVVTAGGFASITKAQAQAVIVDRLA